MLKNQRRYYNVYYTQNNYLLLCSVVLFLLAHINL